VHAYQEAHFCTTERTAKKWITNPRFKNTMIVNKDCIISFATPARTRMNKAYIVGFSILELSKEFMFRQFYTKIKPALKNCDVLFSDTDSLCMTVYNEKNPAKKLGELMDFSNFPKDHPQFDMSNAFQLGKWKDEMQGNEISEYVGLRAKSYSLKIRQRNEGGRVQPLFKVKNTCKGVKKAYKTNITFANYLNCIKSVKSHSVVQYNFKSSTHEISTIRVNRVAFSSFDDKRYLCPCSVHSLPYGSKFIKYVEETNKCPLC
jgi:hypothetical protein